MTDVAVRTPMLHIRFDGRSFEVGTNEIDAGVGSSDADVRRATAEYLSRLLEQPIPASKFSEFTVERNETSGDVTIRPPATFGQ